METIQYTDPYGRKRVGLKKTCLNCETEFYSRADHDRKFCSHDCSAKFRSRASDCRVELTCDSCKTVFYRRKSHMHNSKSGLFFCSRKCKEFAQSLAGGVKAIQPSHYGTSTIIDYRALFTDEELVCARCGFDEWKSCVEIHHIDENRDNNDKSNLIPLCCRCHQGLHRNCWKFEELSFQTTAQGEEE